MSATATKDPDKHLHVMLGSLERRGPWQVPTELDVRVMWGNAELDLREATLAPGLTTITVGIKMGNLEVITLPGVPVELAVSPVLGNAENHHTTPMPPASADPEPLHGAYRDPSRPAPSRIRIVGTVKLGNVEVHEAERGEEVTGHGSNDERRMHRMHANRERHLRRQLANHERHSRRHRRWRELHEEREMWRREMHRSQWVPWWLSARMRRRIFSWLALAVIGGFLVGWNLDARPPWWGFVLGFVAIFMASGAIAFRLTRPLLMVVRAARDIGDGKLDTRIDVTRHGGEMRLLGGALNDMAGKIQQQLADQRQLLAAVSHELRTPLGHMRVLVETARDTNNLAALEKVEQEILVLDDLVGKLLASSRLEFGNLQRHPLDLGPLVTDTATAAGIAPESIEAIGDVVAPVDPTLVRRALANLIDNAKTHAGGAVAVRVERRAGQVAIEVDDAGPGVAADRRNDAFRAFVPSSGGGLGLGLALVSRIAVAHGGGAWIQDRPGGGSRIGFSLTA